MVLELGKAFNGGAAWLCESSAVHNLVKNPIAVALLITALVLVIISVVGPGTEAENQERWRRTVKTGFWLTFGVAILLFVHYYALEGAFRSASVQTGVRSVVDSIHHSATLGGGYAVYPPSTAADAAAPAAAEDAAAGPPAASPALRPPPPPSPSMAPGLSPVPPSAALDLGGISSPVVLASEVRGKQTATACSDSAAGVYEGHRDGRRDELH